MDRERVQRLYEYALAEAAKADDHRDRELGPIHLLEIAYLADLAWAAHHDGETWTGIPWRFHHFGPWDVAAWQQIDPTARRDGADVRRISHPQAEDDSVRYRLPPGEYAPSGEGIDFVVRRSVKHAVKDFGNDTAALLHHVYATAPMVNAAPGERLDFSHEPPARRRTPPERERSALTHRQKKKRKARLEALRHRIDRSLAEKIDARKRRAEEASRSGSRPPRYDDVYADGTAWLDSLAGDVPPQDDLEVEIADAVWKSETRKTKDVG